MLILNCLLHENRDFVISRWLENDRGAIPHRLLRASSRTVTGNTWKVYVSWFFDFLKSHFITEYFQNRPWRPQLPPNWSSVVPGCSQNTLQHNTNPEKKKWKPGNLGINRWSIVNYPSLPKICCLVWPGQDLAIAWPWPGQAMAKCRLRRSQWRWARGPFRVPGPGP